MIQYFCVHHKPAVDRKKYIEDNILHNQKITITWIDNFDPNCKEILNLDRIYCQHSSNGSYLSNAELSCYLKHKFAMSIISDSQEYAVVFEDDIEIPNFDLNTTIEFFISQMIEKKIDILFIGSYGNADIISVEPKIICNKNTKSRCSHAYIVNPIAATKLENHFKNIMAPLDWQLNYAIEDLSLKSCWSYPHIYQRTEKKHIQSLIR